MNGMLRAVAVCAAVTWMWGCDAETTADGRTELTTEDVDAITPGDAVGVVYSGLWTLSSTVSSTDCDNFNIGGTLPLPSDGDMDEDDLPLAQNGGELTFGLDSLGDVAKFKGAVNADDSFTIGQIVSFTEFTRIEILNGRFTSADTLEGTASRYYEAGPINCLATASVTGTKGGPLAGSGDSGGDSGGDGAGGSSGEGDGMMADGE